MNWGLLCQHPDEDEPSILQLEEGDHQKTITLIHRILDTNKCSYNISWLNSLLYISIQPPPKSKFPNMQNLIISTMRGNCGVAELSNITHLEYFWDVIQELLVACNYTAVQLGTINSPQKEALETLGFQLYNTFVNKRSKNTCYLLMKQL